MCSNPINNLAATQNPNTPFSEYKTWLNQCEAAQNLNTPQKVLAELATNLNLGIRKNVAANPSTPSETLTKLTEQYYFAVCELVAKNPNTPSETLTKLSQNTKFWSQKQIASNLPPSPKHLSRLKDSKYTLQVHENVAGNPNTSPYLLHEWATNHPHTPIRKAATQNFALQKYLQRKAENEKISPPETKLPIEILLNLFPKL